MAVTTPVGSVMDRHSISVASEVISSTSESNTFSLKGSSRRKKGPGGVYKSTAQSDSPSHIASIPSKYQTFFVQSSEHQGFNSTSRRFGSSTNELADDNPGPGTYIESDKTTDRKKIESFSKKGTGGLASKTRRFPHRTRGVHALLGPGSYDPVLFPPRADFNRAEYSSNFHCPIAIKKSPDEHHATLPAPNAYNINTPTSGGTNMSSVAFKSTSKRAQLINSNNPGPGQYYPKDTALHPSVCTQKANFLSKTNRKGQLDAILDNPGPADYHNKTDTTSSSKPRYRQKHYLCMSAPAIPLPPMPPPPGPGHYEVSLQGDNPQLVSGAVFKSTSSRWSRPMYNKAPGPGAYEPRSIGKQSFLYNISHNWV